MCVESFAVIISQSTTDMLWEYTADTTSISVQLASNW
jgi:hypothetical protein